MTHFIEKLRGEGQRFRTMPPYREVEIHPGPGHFIHLRYPQPLAVPIGPGSALRQVPSFYSFWFAWSDFYVNTDVYQAEDEEPL